MKYQLIKPVNESYSTIEQILSNRGIPYDEIGHYLTPTPMDNLSPLLLDHIEDAAKIILSHLGDRVYLQTDSDCDGLTSAALLLNYLHARFPSCIPNITYAQHPGKQHGIDTSMIPEDTKLVIVPDAGSADYEIHKELHDKGIDVVVLDHHEAPEVSAYACVVNNQLCGYPTKSLSGVGIVYKFCQYLDSLFGDNLADDYLDLVAIGMTGDVMSMRDIETHYLTQLGLAHLRNPFIAAMREKNAFSLGDVLSPIGVAFYIVPLMNAVTRVGTQEEKQLLFESMLEWKAYEMIPSTKRGHKGEQEQRVEQAVRTCTNVKTRQGKEQDQAVTQIEEIIAANELDGYKTLIIRVPNRDYDRNITGLIANKIMSKYQKPVILLSPNEDGTWGGSARSCAGLDNFKDLIEQSGFYKLCAGHQGAFGYGGTEEDIEQLQAYLEEALAEVEFTTNYKVDYIWQSNKFNPRCIKDIERWKCLWGTGVEEPLIAIEGIKVTKDMLTLMARDRNPTLKIELSNGVSLIKFKSSEAELQNLESDGYTLVNVVGRCEVNRYNGREIPQILVSDYEVVGREKYYF